MSNLKKQGFENIGLAEALFENIPKSELFRSLRKLWMSPPLCWRFIKEGMWKGLKEDNGGIKCVKGGIQCRTRKFSDASLGAHQDLPSNRYQTNSQQAFNHIFVILLFLLHQGWNKSNFIVLKVLNQQNGAKIERQGKWKLSQNWWVVCKVAMQEI